MSTTHESLRRGANLILLAEAGDVLKATDRETIQRLKAAYDHAARVAVELELIDLELDEVTRLVESIRKASGQA